MIASGLCKHWKGFSPFIIFYDRAVCCDIVTLLDHNVVEVFSSSKACEVNRKWDASKGDQYDESEQPQSSECNATYPSQSD